MSPYNLSQKMSNCPFFLVERVKIVYAIFIDTRTVEAEERGTICGYQAEVKYSEYTGGSSYV